MLSLWAGFWVLQACAPEPETVQPPVEPTVDAVALARRTSLALTGAPPSVEALAGIRSGDPLADWIEVWLASEAFADTTVELHLRDLGLPDDLQRPLPSVGPLEGSPSGALLASLQQSPGERIRHIVTEDLAWSTLLEGDTVWVDAVLAEVYGLEHAAGGQVWQRARWPDGRPHGGLLGDSALHQALGGSSVHRAAVLARFLVCDSLEGEHDGSETACARCHATLDPLASLLEPLQPPTPADIAEAHASGCPTVAPCYPLGQLGEPVEGLWYGEEARDLAELAQAARADPRLGRCVAQRTWHDLVGRAPTDAELREVTAALEDQGGSLRALAREIVTQPAFATEPPMTLERPRVARALEALTGFRWEVSGGDDWGRADAATSRQWGAGDVTEGPSAAWFGARAAEQAAGYAVDQALADASSSVLFPDGLPTEPTDAALGHLHQVILSEEADLVPARALWSAVEAEAGSEEAWRAVVAALLQELTER